MFASISAPRLREFASVRDHICLGAAMLIGFWLCLVGGVWRRCAIELCRMGGAVPLGFVGGVSCMALCR